MSEEVYINNIEEIKSILKNIDWGFDSGARRQGYDLCIFNSRSYHWYPGTFIPEIPYTLIEVITKKGASVYDPFMGIGTTLFQSLILGRIPYGSDNCRVTVEYVRSIIRIFNKRVFDVDIHDALLKIINGYCDNVDYFLCINDKYDCKSIVELKPWYEDAVYNKICFLILSKIECDCDVIRNLLSVAISSILASSSNQDRGWGCIADNVLPKDCQVRNVDVFKKIISVSTRLVNDLRRILIELGDKYYDVYDGVCADNNIISSDILNEFVIRNSVKESSIDLVVTSPPYPNMADYSLSQRLSYYYYGLDLKEDKQAEIGARYKRQTRNPINEYVEKMCAANKVIAASVKRGGVLCYVMPIFSGDNNVERKMAVQKVMGQLEENGLLKELELERSLPDKRRSHNIKWSTLEKEMIYIYRKK